MRRILAIGVAVWLAAFNPAYGNEASPVCEELSTVFSTFAGAATGYQMVFVYGAPSGWVAAGLYAAGAGLAAAGVKTSTQAICEDLEPLMDALGDALVEFACDSLGACSDVHAFANSLLFDFAVCPSCTPDEILGAAFMVDDQRENYLRELQRLRNPNVMGFGVVPRDHLGVVDASVVLSYHLGVQAGRQQQLLNGFVQPGMF